MERVTTGEIGGVSGSGRGEVEESQESPLSLPYRINWEGGAVGPDTRPGPKGRPTKGSLPPRRGRATVQD